MGLTSRTMDMTSSSEMVNFSFAGFTTSDIFDDSMWIIQPKSKSTTISVNPAIYDELMKEFNSRYGPPQDKGIQHGHIYRCWISTEEDTKERITITCYLSTHTLSIQGSQHYKWTSTELVQDIGEKLTLNSSHSVASPLTSTPMISSPQLQANVSTQSLNLTPHIVTSSTTHANVEIQTEVITCSTGTQTDVSTTATFPDAPSSDSVIVDIHEEPTSTTPSKSDSVIIDIPAIPTSNLFSSLAVEDTTHDSEPEDGFPPLPLPNPIPKKCTSSPTRPATSPTKPATATECVITMPDEPSPPSSSSSDQTPGSPSQNSSSTQRKTILIIGDSIPKYLVGRKMSRQYRVVNRCIPGSKLELWIQLAPIIITEEQPSAVIIHCGTNNVYSNLVPECVELYKLLTTAMRKVNPSVKIIASSLTVQLKYASHFWIKEFNARLRDLCTTNRWSYVDNDNIRKSNLARDGLHLSRTGTSLLAKNFISQIKMLADQDFQKRSNKLQKT